MQKSHSSLPKTGHMEHARSSPSTACIFCFCLKSCTKERAKKGIGSVHNGREGVGVENVHYALHSGPRPLPSPALFLHACVFVC